MGSGIIRIIKARIIALNRELEEARRVVNEKENELQLAKIALRAVLPKESESRMILN